MNEQLFWSLIGDLDWSAEGDDDAVIEPVVTRLASLGVETITAFDELLAKKLFALDTREHAENIGRYGIGGSYFSPDNFLYARCVVVANGRDTFEEVIRDPTLFPRDLEFEALLSIPSHAFERLTGDEYAYTTSVSPETFSNTEGWS